MRTVLILHGWGSSAQNWQEIKQKLESDDFRVLAPDLPGFGKSSPPKYAWSVDDYVDWLNGFCEKQNISQFFLFGHSFGGRIAIKFAVKYPEKLKGLILTSAAGIKNKSISVELTKKGVKLFPKGVRRLLGKFFYRSKGIGIMKEVFKKVVDEDLTPYLAQIKTPCLILWGRKDKLTPLSHGYLMKEKIPNSQIKVIEEIGHSLRREAPQFLIQKIKEFTR